MFILRSSMMLVIALTFSVLSAPSLGQEVDEEKLNAAKKAAYEAYLPKALLDNKPVKPINVDAGAKGHAAYIYGNAGQRPSSTITGPTWNRSYSNYNDYYGNFNYNFNYSRPVSSNLAHHYGHRNPFHRSGYFVVGENYTLPSVFQDNYDSRYRRSQPKLFKVRTHVPQHYVFKNGRYHFVRGHSKTEYVPMVTRFIRTRYNHGHHSISIDYSN